MFAPTALTVAGAVPVPGFSADWLSAFVAAGFAGLLALIASALLLGPTSWFLKRGEVLDVPNERSSHGQPTIRGLGIAVMVAWAAVVTALGKPPLFFILSVLVVVLVGAVDDFHRLSARMRLIIQLLSAAVLAGGLVSELKPNLLPLLAFAFLLVFITAMINAANFMDGVNGISGLHAVLWGLTYAVILVAFVSENSPWPIIAAGMAGSFLAFLPLNARRNAAGFLGDSGSYGLGAIVGSLAVVTWAVTGSWIASLLPLGIYGADTLMTAIRRLVNGHSLLTAHRDHIYQRNRVRTNSGALATSLTVVGSLLLSINAILFAYARVSVSVALMVALIVLVAYVLSPVLFHKNHSYSRLRVYDE